jgi:hypothetical protein
MEGDIMKTVSSYKLECAISDARARFALVGRALDITNGGTMDYTNEERTAIWMAFHDTIEQAQEVLDKRCA